MPTTSYLPPLDQEEEKQTKASKTLTWIESREWLRFSQMTTLPTYYQLMDGRGTYLARCF